MNAFLRAPVLACAAVVCLTPASAAAPQIISR